VSSSSSRPPLIGLTTYRSPAQMDGYDSEFVALPAQYVEGITRAGGVGVLIPPQPLDREEARRILASLSGLVICGGWDIEPSLYGQKPSDKLEATDSLRDATEMTLLGVALDRDMPVLGICRGAQMLNVHLGGTLHQHVPDVTGSDRYRKPGGLFTDEDMTLVPGSRLASIFSGDASVPGPVQHHQAIDQVAASLVVSARGPDGIVQGVEAPEKSFCVAVQWHPEENLDDIRIFDALVTEAARYRATTTQEVDRL
jgi:putative glutamine amidotransferase